MVEGASVGGQQQAGGAEHTHDEQRAELPRNSRAGGWRTASTLMMMRVGEVIAPQAAGLPAVVTRLPPHHHQQQQQQQQQQQCAGSSDDKPASVDSLGSTWAVSEPAGWWTGETPAGWWTGETPKQKDRDRRAFPCPLLSTPAALCPHNHASRGLGPRAPGLSRRVWNLARLPHTVLPV